MKKRYLWEFDNDQIMEIKMKEIDNWEGNDVLEEVKNTGQKAINTKLDITEKVIDEKMV